MVSSYLARSSHLFSYILTLHYDNISALFFLATNIIIIMYLQNPKKYKDIDSTKDILMLILQIKVFIIHNLL